MRAKGQGTRNEEPGRGPGSSTERGRGSTLDSRLSTLGGGSALDPRPSTLRPRANRKAMIIGVQVFIGLALTIAVVGGLWDQAQQPPEAGAAADAADAAGIPAQIAGLRRTQTVTGPQAVAQMQELHGKDVGVVNGWIAHYGNDGIIWYGEARDEATAIQLLEAMTRRIQAGNRVFTGLKQLQVEGRPVFTVAGQGQRHYYYRQGRLVIWVGAPPGQEEDFMREAVRVLR